MMNLQLELQADTESYLSGAAEGWRPHLRATEPWAKSILYHLPTV